MSASPATSPRWRRERTCVSGSSASPTASSSEALTALLDFGFSELELNRVEGEVSDTGLYGLLAREWRTGGRP